MFRLATWHWIWGVWYKEPCFNCCFSSLLQDDMQIRVFNYNTLERVHMFEAHSDYIRCIAVHPTQPFILTSSGKTSLVYFDISFNHLFLGFCSMPGEELHIFSSFWWNRNPWTSSQHISCYFFARYIQVVWFFFLNITALQLMLLSEET